MTPKIICNFGVVNQKRHILIRMLMLGMITLMPSICYGRSRAADSMLINRMWEYYEHQQYDCSGVEQNLYMKYQIATKRRNILLFLIPTMYSIARGDKEYVSESYNKLHYHNAKDFSIQRQVICGTIPHNRNVMPALFDLLTPNLHSVQLYHDKILSPFHRTNRYFYKYRVNRKNGRTVVHFRPRSSNTQLIRGESEIDRRTGRVLTLKFEGEFDMINFKIDALMNRFDASSPLPDQCTTEATFKFMGNNIKSTISTFYNCPTTLPDSIDDVEDYQLMKKLRPIPLEKRDKAIYRAYELQEAEAERNDTIHKSSNKLKEAAWDFVGDNLINSTHTHTENISLNISPLLNPLYMGYSPSLGISYKLNVGARYAWNKNRYLTLNPQFGYSFKRDQFYYTLPLRMTYNPKRNGYAEVTWGNGNRTSHAALYEAYQKVMGDTAVMPEFKDEYVQLVNNIMCYDWLELTTGVIYHRRWSVDPEKMDEAGLTSRYNSFAPLISVRLRPWKKGPTLTANYERSFSNIFHSNLNYERWEFDAAYKHQNKSVRILNLRAGAGFYSHRTTDFFVDYTNFRDNNLATGWEDDWSGQFQLVDSRWYNSSEYYLRGHLSYDSPLLMLSWMPWIGRIVETERIYLSAMSIENTRPYFEIGYGFKTRYLSTAFFASFLNTQYQKFGCKFTLELFRRW